jgi:hypothetical protein
MRRTLFRRSGDGGASVLERIRPVEVPILTEAKRRLARGDVGGALRYAYPRVLDDLGRAYDVEFPPGFSHEEIVGRAFTEPMQPLRVFFDGLYQLYAPVRFGGSALPGRSNEVLEMLRSLYAAEPMWRLYVRPREPERAPPAGAASEAPGPTEE